MKTKRKKDPRTMDDLLRGMLDMAEQNIGEINELADCAAEKKKARDLSRDLARVREWIEKGAPTGGVLRLKRNGEGTDYVLPAAAPGLRGNMAWIEAGNVAAWLTRWPSGTVRVELYRKGDEAGKRLAACSAR